MKKLLLFLLLAPLFVLGQAQLELPYSVKVLNPKPLDAYYYNTSFAPYTSVSQATTQISFSVRFKGLTVNVNGIEYWFGNGITDPDLIPKSQVSASNHKLTAQYATLANLTLSGAQTVDAFAVVTGDLVLVKNQTTGSQNGLYVANTSGAWTRSTDFTNTGDVYYGNIIDVVSGRTLSKSTWIVSTANPIIIGTTAITFTLRSLATFTQGFSTFTNSPVTYTNASVAGFQQNITIIGQGTITLTNGSTAITGIGTNFNDNQIGLKSTFYLWVFDSNFALYYANISSVTNDLAAVASNWDYNQNGGFRASTTGFPGVTGTYTYYLALARSGDPESYAIGNGAYVTGNRSIVWGGGTATGQYNISLGPYTHSVSNGCINISGSQSTTLNTGAVRISGATSGTSYGQNSVVLNGVDAVGTGTFAMSDGSNAIADRSTAIGFNTFTGLKFSYTSSGSTITITGDVTAFFTNGNTVVLYQPAFGTSMPFIQNVFRRTTINSVPAFGGVNTTFTVASIPTAFTSGTITNVTKPANSVAIGFGQSTTTGQVTTYGRMAINISEATTALGVNKGSLADYGVILGGLNNHIPINSTYNVILGGSAVSARAGETKQVYLHNLNVIDKPINNDTLTQLIVRDWTTGQIKFRKAGSLSTSFSTARKIPYMNSGGTNFDYTPDFQFDNVNQNLWLNWNASAYPNSAFLHQNVILGEEHVVNINPNSITDMAVVGDANSIGDPSGSFSGSSSFTFGDHNTNNGLGSFVGGSGGGGGSGRVLNGGGSGGVAVGISSNTVGGSSEKVTSAGGSLNISFNSTAQTAGHGAYGNLSAIVGGQDHNIPSTSPRSAIIGGDAIKARASDANQVYVPNLNIVSTPINNDTLTQVLARDWTTGQVKYKRTFLSDGTYTPSLTNVTNTTASTAYVTGYYRIGASVTVFGKVDVNPTLGAGTATEIGISLPIASNFTAEEDLGGTAVSDALASETARVKADATNDRAAVIFKSISITNDSYSFEFSYRIK